MSINFFVFSTGELIGYVTSHFIQGARMAGFQVFSNNPSLKVDGRHCRAHLENFGVMFKEQPGDSDLVIIDETRNLSHYEDLGYSYLKSLIERPDAARFAMIYSQDDVNLLKFPDELLTFTTHQVSGFSKSLKSLPIPYGFTAEGFEAARSFSKIKDRVGAMILNFNPTFSQSVRETVVLAMESMKFRKLLVDQKQVHGDAYSEQLGTSQFCIAIGGTYHWPKTDFEYLRSTMSERSRNIEYFEHRARKVAILRWDSFRFWESMAFGCIPVQFEFETYGFTLPQNPTPWVHYVPLNLSNLSESFERMSGLLGTDYLSYMTQSAMSWARDQGHPESIFRYVFRSIADRAS